MGIEPGVRRISVLTAGVAAAVLAVLASAPPASGQAISGATVGLNAGNSPGEFQDGTFESYERTTSVAITSSTTSIVRVRYEEVVGVDEGLGGSDRTETQSSDYTLSFNVTAPGAYILTVSTSLSG